MIELTSEYDLWQLFGGEGPETQGAKDLAYTDFFDKTSRLVLEKKKVRRGFPKPRFNAGKASFLPRFAVADTDHFYLLRSPDVEAVVDQARLYVTAGKIGGPDLRVAYLFHPG